MTGRRFLYRKGPPVILSVIHEESVRVDVNEFENTFYSVGGHAAAPNMNICITKGSCCCSSSQTQPVAAA